MALLSYENATQDHETAGKPYKKSYEMYNQKLKIDKNGKFYTGSDGIG
jgi:hypothetical protein